MNTITEHPYPGLRPFTREESDIFFGREEQSDQLLAKLGETRFIAVVGLSGCGKSSLVRAGMIPNLESGYLVSAGAYWRIATMRPGNTPIWNLAEALLDDSALGGELRAEGIPDPKILSLLLASLRRGSFGVVEILRETPLPKGTNLLIVVDQFEELFRYHREGGRDETEAFVNLLLTSARHEEFPIYVVTTMRSEYIGDCALFYGLPEVMNRGQFLVPRLTREQQEMAILGPAGVFGGTIEDRLVNRLLNEMGNDPDQLPLHVAHRAGPGTDHLRAARGATWQLEVESVAFLLLLQRAGHTVAQRLLLDAELDRAAHHFAETQVQQVFSRAVHQNHAVVQVGGYQAVGHAFQDGVDTVPRLGGFIEGGHHIGGPAFDLFFQGLTILRQLRDVLADAKHADDVACDIAPRRCAEQHAHVLAAFCFQREFKVLYFLAP